MTWQRARSDEQIEQRIGEILDASAKLYQAHRFEEITFAMIAKESNFTRSNLYRYFKTKEDIFLKLLAHDISMWREDIQDNLPEPESSPHDFAKRWVALLSKRRRMLQLFAILYTILEKNASLEALIEFKKSIQAELNIAIAMMVSFLPALTPEKASEFLQASLSLSIGIHPLMDLTEKQKEAMTKVGMPYSAAQYQAVWEHSIESLLRGLIS